jgi:para-aminobenzoate synthetase component 1
VGNAAGGQNHAATGQSDTARNIHHATPLRRTFSREAYEKAVVRIREHIYEGDVYQVNLSQRFVFPLTQDPFSLWLKLFDANPAPFYAWVDAGDHQILSTSMERLFLLERDDRMGDRIETRPIKGTRARGSTPEEDLAQERALTGSTKDDAELSMIVDLARNDCGRVCRAGSVYVHEHKRVEKYANVMHLVSVVEGRLRRDAAIDDVFRALFPGGSITGCPKIRSMEIIDANEPVTRHVYTGSIGLMEADGRVDFNIAIRTAIVRDGQCHLSVGGGIVYDSDPVEEFMETLHKGATFFQLADINPDSA